MTIAKKGKMEKYYWQLNKKRGKICVGKTAKLATLSKHFNPFLGMIQVKVHAFTSIFLC